MGREETDTDSIGVAAVEVADSFWSPRIRTNREITIGHQYEQLEESGTLENFLRAAEGKTGGFQGMWFQDSDAYKWLEAASYVLATDDDPELESRVDDVVELVAAAQEDDGYLNTYFALEESEKRWTNLHMMHELYCGGHLIEAAVAHYRATDDRTLLDVGIDFANHVIDVFDDFDGVPGHEEIELALVKLYYVTDQESYLDLAEYFVNRRGRTGRLAREFDRYDVIGGSAYDGDWEGTIEAGARSVFVNHEGEYDGSYAQDHAPVVDQETVEGHSVRAMYLYASMADLARERQLPEFVDALEDLWENMTEKRMYITGGIGSEPAHEGFTEDYELRNEGAYAETCAAVGSIFWNQRMFELTGAAKYADLIERTLYNGFLAGISLDGTEFFYENPLASDGDHHRKGWFTCACCPPNVARLFASLGNYIYARDSGITINQYIGSTVKTSISGKTVTISQESTLPWSGEVTIDVDATGVSFPIRLRIPQWAESTIVTVNGEQVDVPTSGYFEVEREWIDDRIELIFEQTVTRMTAHPAVEADAGLIALERGPLVYCLEDVDHDRPIHQYEISSATFTTEHRSDLLDGVTVIEGKASVPELDEWDTQLYRPAVEADRELANFIAVPYFAWDNRDPGPMRVWIRSQSIS